MPPIRANRAQPRRLTAASSHQLTPCRLPGQSRAGYRDRQTPNGPTFRQAPLGLGEGTGDGVGDGTGLGTAVGCGEGPDARGEGVLVAPAFERRPGPGAGGPGASAPRWPPCAGPEPTAGGAIPTCPGRGTRAGDGGARMKVIDT